MKIRYLFDVTTPSFQAARKGEVRGDLPDRVARGLVFSGFAEIVIAKKKKTKGKK